MKERQRVQVVVITAFRKKADCLLRAGGYSLGPIRKMTQLFPVWRVSNEERLKILND
jgi:hypothetical protein